LKEAISEHDDDDDDDEHGKKRKVESDITSELDVNGHVSRTSHSQSIQWWVPENLVLWSIVVVIHREQKQLGDKVHFRALLI
jgi:hypothetical protein